MTQAEGAGRAVGRAVTMVALLLTACGSPGSPTDRAAIPRRTDAIVIGAFNFAESHALAHVYAEALERAGFDVEVLQEVASREIMEPALEQGEIDLVPEYLGTALTFLDPDVAGEARSVAEAHRSLGAAFGPQGVRVLDPAPGQNRNEIVVTSAFADQHSLQSISDLSRIDSQLVFGGPPECPSRPLCIGGLEDSYGLSFEFRPLDSGGPLTVAALVGNEIDVGLLFTTNPSISTHRLVVLEDDRDLQPPENIVPVLRAEVASRFGPRLANVINEVSAKVTDGSLRRLNEWVEFDELGPVAAARRWLVTEGMS